MQTGQKTSDKVFLVYLIILLVFGLMMLTSASSAIGIDRFNDSYFFVKRQLLYGILPGIVVFLIFAKVPYQYLHRYSMFVYIVSIALLILVFIPGVGTTYNTGSRSWLDLGNFSFQPAEFAKFALIIFLAGFLSKKGVELKDFQKGFLVTLGVSFVPMALVILQPDIGTVAILFSIIFGMLFVAEANLKHIGLLALAGFILFVVMVLVAPYRAARLTTFLHPELDPQGVGYQINQAFIAIGSGGLFGLGLGHSRQKFQYLPEVHADSIFAIIAEEMGFFISVGFIILLVLLCIRGLKIANHAPDSFSKYLVAGIMIWFISQAFLNIGAIVGLLPLTGVPLPFVSHGGTALMIGLAAFGSVLNVSKYT